MNFIAWNKIKRPMDTLIAYCEGGRMCIMFTILYCKLEILIT